jgi:hypothetical protein
MKSFLKLKLFYFFVFLFILLSFGNYANAQQEIPDSGIGFSASIQNNHFGIQVPIWLNDNFILAPNFGAIFTENRGGEIQLGLIPRIFFKKQTVSPYLGFLVGTVIGLPENRDNTFDFVFGLSFGLEYFINKHFSLSIEGQINGTKSDNNSLRYNNPGSLNLNTATGFAATIYF